MEDFGVIEQDCDHIDFDVEDTGIIVIEEEEKEKVEKVEKVEKEKKQIKKTTNKEYPNRCTIIKKNGQQCRQRGKPNQSGGPIINGFSNYHKQNS